ncbi:MAG: ZIP family metal transporter [Paracoccaceae bacterium]
MNGQDGDGAASEAVARLAALGDDPVAIVFLGATLTALATGLGALPFLFARRVGGRTLGAASAVAAGLMLAASHALLVEGQAVDRALLLGGVLAGFAAIVASDRLLGESAKTGVADLHGADARKALLILGVMTAHSFAEGVGVGVAYGGREGLGAYVTAAIALHNVPEGLAIALVLVPRGTAVWKAALWAVFTSLPQPIMAVPSFLFVETFAPFLPVGLGLAAGAMVWMVFAELIPDAFENATPEATATALTLAFAAMLGVQFFLIGG